MEELNQSKNLQKLLKLTRKQLKTNKLKQLINQLKNHKLKLLRNQLKNLKNKLNETVIFCNSDYIFYNKKQLLKI